MPVESLTESIEPGVAFADRGNHPPIDYPVFDIVGEDLFILMSYAVGQFALPTNDIEYSQRVCLTQKSSRGGQRMRHRGPQYWLWVNKRFPSRIHDERLKDGRLVEVQARVTPSGEVQTFVGIYAENGTLMHEEFHDRRCVEHLATALNWGVQRARTILLENQPFCAPHRAQLTLGPVIVDATVLALRRMEMTDHEERKLKMRDANAEYAAAKSAMLVLMRSSSIDPSIWDAHRARLQQAIDRRVNVLRNYLP